MEDTNVLESLQGLSPEEKASKLEELYKAEAEAKRKLQADTDRGVQKVLDEKRYLEAVNQVLSSKDNVKLMEIWETNPQLAQKIANEHFDGITREQAIEYWKTKGYVGGEAPKSGLTKEDIKEMIEQEKIEQSIKDFKANSRLDEETLSKWEAEFKELTEGKKLNATNINKYIRLAQKEVIPDTKEAEHIAKDMAFGIGSSGGKTNPVDNIRKQNIEWLKNNNR